MTEEATFRVLRDGITEFPPGHVAAIKSYLEMVENPRCEPLPAPAGYGLAPLGPGDSDRYRSIFSVLGRRWLWWSRLKLDDTALSLILGDPAIRAFAVTHPGGDVGLFELDFREPARPDLAFLGLFDGHTGSGVGTWLISVALASLWEGAPEAVTVNTCTFDHPAAPGFYRRLGFQIARQCIEVVPDPRIAGLLPPDAAPHVPLRRA